MVGLVDGVEVGCFFVWVANGVWGCGWWFLCGVIWVVFCGICFGEGG